MNPLERALQWIRQELMAHPTADASSSATSTQRSNHCPAEVVTEDIYCAPLYAPLDNGICPSSRDNPRSFNPRRIPEAAGGPLGWQRLPENNWVPAVMCLMHSIRAVDVELTGIPSNESQDGCRNPEFQYGTAPDPGEPNVCWAPHTLASILAATRLDQNIDEPVVNTFIARYDNEPLDASGRSPLPFGRSFIGVEGFFAAHANADVPTSDIYNFMHPPHVAMEASVNLCESTQSCLWNLFYQFQGAFASFASDTEARRIVGFWDSLGYGDLYRVLHYPQGSIDMTQRDFMEHVVRPTLSPLRSRFLQTHHQTYSVNPDLFSFSEMQRATAHFQMLPVATRFPNGSVVRLLEQVSLGRELAQTIASLNQAPAGENAEQNSARRERRDFFTQLLRGYGNQNRINEIYLNPPVPPNASSNTNVSQLLINSPAFDFEIPIGENGSGGSLKINHLLADNIQVSGPNLHDLLTNRWNNTTPIQITIHSPSIGSMDLVNGPLHIQLPEMRADEISITLPPMNEMRRILQVDETHPFLLTNVMSNIQELLPFCSLRVRNLKIDNRFSVGYTESQVSVRGAGGQIDELILTTDVPNSRIEPDPRYSDRRIPHLLITHGVLRDFSIGANIMGHIDLAAPRNIIESVNVLFPYNRAILTTPRLATEGTLVYDSTPAANDHHSNSPNFVPSHITLGNSGEGSVNRTQIRNISVELDYTQATRMQWRVDCDIHSDIVPGTILFPNPNFPVHLEGGHIDGAHLHSVITTPRENSEVPISFSTFLSGAMTLNFAGSYPFGNSETPVSVEPHLSNVTAQSTDACIYFSRDDQSRFEMFVGGRVNERGDNICREASSNPQLAHVTVPDHHPREVPALHGSPPITLDADFVKTRAIFRHLPFIGTLNTSLNGHAHLGVQGFWLNHDGEWEVDSVSTGMDHLQGTADARGHHIQLTNPDSSVSAQNHITLGRVRVQGHQGAIAPDQMVMLGLNVYLSGRSGSLLDLDIPYFGYYDGGSLSIDLPHSRINTRYNGLPEIHWSRMRRR